MAGFQDLKVNRTVDFTGAVQRGITGNLHAPGGKTFYIDGTSGADSYGITSQNFDYPLLTITAAVALCTAGKGDAIAILRNSPSSPPSDETFPVVLSKAGVLLTGMYSRGLLSDSGFGADETDTDCINITANYVNVENLYLGIKTGSTTSDVVSMGTVYGFCLRNCHIEGQYTARYGVSITADAPWTLIEDNVFGRSDVSSFTNAIRVIHATGSVFRRNLITGSASYGFYGGASAGTFCILDNRFQLYADTDGYAIYLAAGSSNIYADGNHAAHGMSTITNSPYWDANADDSNDWGLNYENQVAVGAVAA